MNNSEQAKKGFQTFVLTLSVSLILFSVLYYIITTVNSTKETPVIEKELKTQVVEDTPQVKEEPGEVAGVTDTTEKTTDTPVEEPAEETSVFGKLAGTITPTPSEITPEKQTPKDVTPEQEPDIKDPEEPAVLQAADTMPEATGTTGTTTTTTTTTLPETQETPTVPDTGTLEVTLGLIVSLAVFVFGAWFVSRDPRKKALSRFENSFFE